MLHAAEATQARASCGSHAWLIVVAADTRVLARSSGVIESTQQAAVTTRERAARAGAHHVVAVVEEAGSSFGGCLEADARDHVGECCREGCRGQRRLRGGSSRDGSNNTSRKSHG
jgi:hypothetical protein